jgi:hypothetical protein
VETSGAAVIRSPAEWEVLWVRIHAGEVPIPPAPPIDFSKAMILAAFLGERPSGGYAIAFAEASVQDGEMRVTVRQQTPAAGGIVTYVITQPYCMALVPRSALPVRFLGVPGGKP